MRWRVFFFVSLGVNVALAAAWILSSRHYSWSGPSRGSVPTANTAGKTNVVLRKQFFSWSEVESDDYPTYIKNLRAIGCPEQTIRDIIIADINALYAARRANEIITPEQQWWRSEPDPEVLRAALEKLRALEDERRDLLARLLGPDWESGDLATLPRPSRPGILLDGPVLGQLSPEVKQAVEDISMRAEDRMQAYVDAQRAAGKNPDPAEVAKIRQQTRLELSGVLTPGQLEEYLLRYSEGANTLRTTLGQLRFFNATPEEFRAIFRATDQLDQQIQLLAGDSPGIVAQRTSLEQQKENAIKQALGPDRYEQYRRLHDPMYRDAYAAALQSGDPNTAPTIYAINMAALSEQTRARGNTNLSREQLAIELKRLELEQLRATAEALGQIGPEPPPAPQPSPTRPHQIRPGETVATVSVMYGIPISAIRGANPDLDFNRLRPGDTIRIPQFVPGIPTTQQ